MESLIIRWFLDNSVSTVVLILLIVLYFSWRKRIEGALKAGELVNSLKEDEEIVTTRILSSYYQKSEVDNIKESTVSAVVKDRRDYCAQVHKDYLEVDQAYNTFASKDSLGQVVDKIEQAINYLTSEIRALRDDVKLIWSKLSENHKA